MAECAGGNVAPSKVEELRDKDGKIVKFVIDQSEGKIVVLQSNKNEEA